MIDAMSNMPGPPLPPIKSGDAALDEALRVIQADFLAETPATTKAFELVNKLRPEQMKPLAGLLVPQAWTYGGFGEWDEDRARKMKPPERTAYKAAHDAAYAAHDARKRYFGWVLGKAVTFPAGCARLLEVMREKQTPQDVRDDIAEALREANNEAACAALVEGFPIESWEELPSPKLYVVCAAAEAVIRSERAQAFEALSPLLLKKNVDRVVAECVLRALVEASRPPKHPRFGVNEEDEIAIEPRWADVAIRFVGEEDVELAHAALLVLWDLPPRPEWRALFAAIPALADDDCKGVIDALLAKLPKAPEKAKEAKEAPPPSGPLPPKRRGKAAKPRHPRYDPPAKLRKQIDAMLAKAKLEKHAAKLIDPAIHLLTERVDESKLALGATKIGGHPDLPPGTQWPAYRGVRLAFVAQIRLEDVAKLGENRLPPKGLLSFFVDDDGDGDDYLQKAIVLHTKDTKKLARLKVPAGFRATRAEREPASACAVKLVPTLTVPSPSHPVVTKLGEAAEAAYREHVSIEHAEVAQLLGFRDHGYDAENPISARLLLRVTSDEQAATSWADHDNLDFYVKHADLARGSFAKVYPYVGD